MSIQIAATFLLILFFGCSDEPETKAPLFKNLGERNHFKITTNSELAQKYFDQGVTLAYGFNHEEAFRSFNEAQGWIQIAQWLIGG